MHDRDLALLMLLAVATVMAVGVFRIRRHRGSSRSMALFAAGCAFGAVCAVAELLLYDAFFARRASIGLERIVTPMVTMFVCTIGSALLAGVLFLVGGRHAATATPHAMSEARRILADVEARLATRTPRQHPTDDWRALATHAAAGD